MSTNCVRCGTKDREGLNLYCKQCIKRVEYDDYVTVHISNVKLIWEVIQETSKGEIWLADDCTYFSINELIKTHDESKWSSDEYEGYRQWFYPVDETKKSKSLFDYSWNHHQKNNPHHWQYWLMWTPEETVAIKMPFEYVIEMLCDWSAMSLKFGDTPTEYYKSQKDNMILHDDTRKCVELYLPEFDKAVASIRQTRGERVE